MGFLLNDLFEGPTNRALSLVVLMIALLMVLVITTSIGLLSRQYLHRSRMARQLRWNPLPTDKGHLQIKKSGPCQVADHG